MFTAMSADRPEIAPLPPPPSTTLIAEKNKQNDNHNSYIFAVLGTDPLLPLLQIQYRPYTWLVTKINLAEVQFVAIRGRSITVQSVYFYLLTVFTCILLTFYGA